MTPRSFASAALAFVPALALAACSDAGSGHDAPEPTAPLAPTLPAELTVTQPTVWVCHPGLDGSPCTEGGLDVIHETAGDDAGPDEPFQPAADPPIDCFYVYPTVEVSLLFSNLPLVLSESTIHDSVKAVTRAQAARFASVCRLYVPLYRQATLLWEGISLLDSLTALLTGAPPSTLAESDIASAWHDYLLHDNQGRGVILIGHSQGAALLTTLIQNEIDGTSEQASLVSALLFGGNILVPAPGASPLDDAGAYQGDFPHLPPCTSDTPTGCIVAYSDFAASEGVPPSGGFGRSTNPNEQVQCTNPADLLHALLTGQSSDPTQPTFLHPYIPTKQLVGTALPLIIPESELPDASAGFVAFPQRLQGSCQYSAPDNASWFQVTDTDPGGYNWQLPASSGQLGLHVMDMNLHTGELVALARAQGALWSGVHGRN